MAKIIVNGVTIAQGKSITIVNGQMSVDGLAVSLEGDLAEAKVFNILVEGNVEQVSGDFASIDVRGYATRVKTMSGDVTVHGGVNGNVETMSGSARIGGSVGGSVKTMSGSIRTGS